MTVAALPIYLSKYQDDKEMANLAGRTALVTGAAKRIGREISIAIASDGADVVLHYNSSLSEAESLKTEIKAMGRNAWTVGQKFTGPDSADELMEKATDAAGRVDILINSASVYPAALEKSHEREKMGSTVMTNAWIPWILSNRFSKIVDSGDIINLLDTRISGHDIGRPVYYLSKQLLRYITEELALILAPRFRVNAIAPGLILPPEGKGPAYFEKLKSDVPLKKSGEARDVSNAVLFLLHSGFITGQIIFLDGGQHLLHRVYGAGK